MYTTHTFSLGMDDITVQQKGMQGMKQEGPEFWCQTYTTEDRTFRHHTRLREPRSKSHSPNHCPPNRNLNRTRQTDSPSHGSPYHSVGSPVIENVLGDKHIQSFESEDLGKQGDSKEQQYYAPNKQNQDCKEKKGHVRVSSGKRKKQKGKSQDRATMRFIRKVKADHRPNSEQISPGHFSSCSDLEVSDNVDSNEKPNLQLNTSNVETGKGTPVLACNIGHEAKQMLAHHPCYPSTSGVCGLGPSMTHNAYVLQWLQQQTNQPQNQHDDSCRQPFQAPTSNSYYPIHSSPLHLSNPTHTCSACTCMSGKQDVTSELLAMIQQGTLQTPAYLLQPPTDFQPVPCQHQHQVPITPDAQSFLAMLQHKPEIPATPCSHHSENTASIQQACHHIPGNIVSPCSSQFKQSLSHTGQTCNSPQHVACPPINPNHTCMHQQSTPSRGYPTNTQCSLEQAAMFLHQSQLHLSPMHLNTSSLQASHGSPFRHALANSMVQGSPVNSSRQVLEDSMLSAMGSYYNGSPDRSKCEDKSSIDNLPPIGVFWDIENCAVPRGKSALAVVQSIRDRFFSGHREAEFLCVCDINKENTTVIQELNDAQVTVAHINATAKNAADDKLKQSLRRFADAHNPPATVVLISGDINFARDLSDLRHRNNLRVILIHRDEASDALKACANESVTYQDLVNELPFRSPAKTVSESNTLIVHNLPFRKDASQLRNRLKQLSENCGGKVLHMSYKNAVIQFPNAEKASRAKIRLEGENVFGSKISVAYPKNKFQSQNTVSPSRGSSNNKSSPQSIEDRNEEMTGSKEEYEQEDEELERDQAQEERLSLSTTLHSGSNLHMYQSNARRPDKNSTSSPQMNCHEDQSPLKTSANRIAAAFRPLQPDATHSTHTVHTDEQYKQVIEIWPKNKSSDVSIPSTSDYTSTQTFPDHQAGCTISKWNWPTSVIFNQHNTYSSSRGQQKADNEITPGLLPFKPIPSVQRIPIPPPGQTIWNRGDNERVCQSPSLRGMYRPPSPMLANPVGDWQYMASQDVDSGVRKGAELLVTNLDNKMTRRDLKQHLLAKLSDHCKVLHLIFGGPIPGRYQAVVRVPSIPDAIRAMSHINRYQIGTRLLHVTLLLPSDSNTDKLRLMIIPMLQEIPGMCLPLSDVKTSFERRYRQVLYVSDLYQIPDTVTIRDTPVGKVVSLTTQSRPSTPISSGFNSPTGYQSPVPFFMQKDRTPEPCEPFCCIHDKQDTKVYRNLSQDPFVIVSLKTFSAQVHTLLQIHNGKIPLISFMVCYAAEFSALTEDYDEGVPLEHLLTCIQGVRVGVSRDGYKTVYWEQRNPETDTSMGSRSSTPLLPPQLFQFSKEAVELLKHTTKCRLPFSKFIPSYHHHFGRQCRVADYGFLKLIELFDAISHALQVLGMTENKLLTLTYRTQIKRFSQDLLKVLKSQASKQMTLQEFPSAYFRCFNKLWNVVDYGVCDIQDLLTEVPENMAMISWNGDNTIVFIPKREQTKEELIRMRKFSREVVELLSYQPRYRILFSKFIPAFHHHFGHQCRVGDYGFNKLLELFEALQDVIEIEEQGDERVVTLTRNEQMSLVAHHTSQMLQRSHLHLISLDIFHQMYAKSYTYPIYFKDFGVRYIHELMAQFPHVVEIVSDGCEKRLHLIDKMHLSQLAQQVLVVLLESDEGHLLMKDISHEYQRVWHQQLVPIEYGHSRLVTLMKTLHYVLTVKNEWMDDCYIELTSVHQFAQKVRSVLIRDNRLSMTFQELITQYHELHGVELQPTDYGHSTLITLIGTVPRVLSIINKGARRAVTLNPSCLAPHLPTDVDETNKLRRLSDQGVFIKKVSVSEPASLSSYESVDSKKTSIESSSSDFPTSLCYSFTSRKALRSQSTHDFKSSSDVGIIVTSLKNVETLSTSPDTDCAFDQYVPEASKMRPSSEISHSDSRGGYITTPNKPSCDSEGRTLTTPSDDSKTTRRSIIRNRGRCQLAANFSLKGTL